MHKFSFSVKSAFGLNAKFFVRTLAVALSAFLISQSISLPLAQAAVIQGESSPISVDYSKLTLNSDHGEVVEQYARTRHNRFVYHIQDVHNHVPAQTNIAGLIKDLSMGANAQNRRLVVFVEGAVGTIDSDEFSANPNRGRVKDVAAAFLNEGVLFGESYAAVTSAPGTISLFGIENPTLYDLNGIARNESKESRAQILKSVRQLKSQLLKLTAYNFNKDLDQLESARRGLESGVTDVSDYILYLKKIAPQVVASHSELESFVKFATLEKSLDYDQIEKEQYALLRELVKKKSKSDGDELTQDALAFENGEISPISYYKGLLKESRRGEYPAMQNYVVYLGLREQIDSDAMFTQLEEAGRDAAESMMKHPISEALYGHIRWIERQERFFALEMIPQEWHRQKGTRTSNFEDKIVEINQFIKEQTLDTGHRFARVTFPNNLLKNAVTGARTFYEAAEKRNEALVSNMLAQTKLMKDSAVVLVAGGFHTEGITALLKKNGYGYEVIRPRLQNEKRLSSRYDFSKPQNTLMARAATLRAGDALSRGPAALRQVIADPAKGNDAVQQLRESQDKPLSEKSDDENSSTDLNNLRPGGGQPLDVTSVLVIGIFIGVVGIGSLFKKLFSKKVAPAAPQNQDLTLEQFDLLHDVTRARNLPTYDWAYLAAMWRQFLYPAEKLRMTESPQFPENRDGGNFKVTALFNSDEWAQMGVIDYETEILNGFNFDPSLRKALQDIGTEGTIIINGMKGGLGESYSRQKYLNARRGDGLESTENVPLSAKLTDVYVDDIELPLTLSDGLKVTEVVSLTYEQIRLLQAIRLAESGRVNKVVMQDLVTEDSETPEKGSRYHIEKALDEIYVNDQFDPKIPENRKRTYRDRMNELGIEIDFHVQNKLPMVPEDNLGQLPLDPNSPDQQGGHAQYGLYFMLEASDIGELRELDGYPKPHNRFRVFSNGEDINANYDEKIVAYMKAKKIPLVMVTTPAQGNDIKFGKLGLRAASTENGTVLVPDIMEIAQAQDKEVGQIDEFLKRGQIGSEKGRQLGNTNLLFFNEDLLGDILYELEKVVLDKTADEHEDALLYELAKIFAPTRIPKGAKNGFLPIDGAIASVLLNINAYFMTATNPRVKEILERHGVTRMLNFVNVSQNLRTQFFTPNKTGIDQVLYESDRFEFDGEALEWVDQNPGVELPGIEFRGDSEPYEPTGSAAKDLGAWADLGDLQNYFENIGYRGNTQFFGNPFYLRNAIVGPNARIVNKGPEGVVVNDIPEISDLFGLQIKGDFDLQIQNAVIVIEEDGTVSVEDYAPFEYKPAPSGFFGLAFGAAGAGETISQANATELLGFGGTTPYLLGAVFFVLAGSYLLNAFTNLFSEARVDYDLHGLLLAEVSPEVQAVDPGLYNYALRLESQINDGQIRIASNRGLLRSGEVLIEPGFLSPANFLTRPLRKLALLFRVSYEFTRGAFRPVYASVEPLSLGENSIILIWSLLFSPIVFLKSFVGGPAPISEVTDSVIVNSLGASLNSPAESAQLLKEKIEDVSKTHLSNKNISGTSVVYVDLGSFQFDEGSTADNIRNAVMAVKGVDYSLDGQTRQSKVVFFNRSNRLDLRAEEPEISKAVSELNNPEQNLSAYFVGRLAIEKIGERNLAEGLAKEAGIPDDINHVSVSKFILSSRRFDEGGLTGVQVSNNFLHLGLSLVSYSRFPDPKAALADLVGRFKSVFPELDITAGSIEKALRAQILAALAA